MNARYYLPEVGRFISPDTIVPEPGNPQSFNRYSYVNDNPVNYTDPSGHWFESALDVAFIAYDIYDIQQNGLTWTSGLSLAADMAGLALPVVTGGGAAVRALAHADAVTNVVTHIDEAIDAGWAIESLVEIGPTIDNLLGATKAFEETGRVQLVPQKRVVIGEGMDAVKAAGREHGAK